MEDSQTKTIEQDNELLIEEMLRDAEIAEVPSELKEHPVIHKGDGELPAPMTLKELSSAGYVYIWDTRTYERMPVLYYMLPSKLRQKRQDGSFRFTSTDPGEKPRRGTLKCWLHPNSPNRAHFDTLGFRICPKSNMTNSYQVTQHMKKKHPQEWAAIEEERKEKERQEDRKLQQALLKSATKTKSK